MSRSKPAAPTTSDTFDGNEKALIDAIAAELAPLYSSGCDAPDAVLGNYPNPKVIVDAHKILIDVLMPGKMSPGVSHAADVEGFARRHLNDAWDMLLVEVERSLPFGWMGEAGRVEGCKEIEDLHFRAKCVMSKFYRRMPDIRRVVTEDTKAAYQGDPAALSYAEVILSYPGLLAIVSHRIAHELYRLDVPIVPRVMSEWSHRQTGVDIHPGARIGHGLFIDHGTGVVIGETTEIGNRVKIYQGVTLGARSFPLDEHGNPIKHIKRHPTVEDDVVIYSNASILGGDTVIGEGSTIGGNVFLMESVPPNSFVAANHPELKIKSPAGARAPVAPAAARGGGAAAPQPPGSSARHQ